MDRRVFIKSLVAASGLSGLENADGQQPSIAERIEQTKDYDFMRLSQALRDDGELSLEKVVEELRKSDSKKRLEILNLFYTMSERSFRLVYNGTGQYLKTKDEKKYNEIVQEYFKYQLLIDYFKRKNGLSERIGKELFGGKKPDQINTEGLSATEQRLNLLWSVISRRRNFEELYFEGRKNAAGIGGGAPDDQVVRAYDAIQALKDIGKDPRLANPLGTPKF